MSGASGISRRQSRSPSEGPRATRRRAPIVASLLVLTLAACGATASPSAVETSGPITAGPAAPSETTASASDGAPAAAVDLPRACDLLTAEDVQAVVGNPVEANDRDGVNCSWSPPEGEDGFIVGVSLVPLDQESCLDVHQALGTTDTFAYESAGGGEVPGFWRYAETLGGTFIGTYELCAPQVNVGVRVEGAPGAAVDEAGQRQMADELVPLVLDRLVDALGS